MKKDVLFHPFDLDDNLNSPLQAIDPDVQYFSNNCNIALQSCNYYHEDSFNKTVNELKINNECLSFIHENIRSTKKNLSSFENYLNTLNHSFSIVGLTETWLTKDNFHCYGLSGYNSEQNVREGKNGGGVGLYIKDNIEYTVRDDLC